MRHLFTFLLGAPIATLGLAAGCASTTAPTPIEGECPSCVHDSDCHSGLCGQFGGDTYCAPDCSKGQACSSDRVCTAVNSTEGVHTKLCVPRTPCGKASGTGGAGGAGGAGGKPGTGTGGQGGKGSVGISGGKLDTLSFAVVGDTRPPSEDDINAYPTAIITKIWQDVEAQSPRPAFALATGDYMFANPFGTQANQQLDLYLNPRKAFSNVLFPVMGNHECTGGTASNCGPGGADGMTTNYQAFMKKMLAPLQVTVPYYVVNVASTSGAWTAKFVMIAANAWTAAQATWLDQALSAPTTYTFVVRHESVNTSRAPGVDPSTAIIAKHPSTLLIVGHTHTYEYRASDREVIVGNGGAPISGGINYGYVVARQRADGAVVFSEYDYMTNLQNQSFAVRADGTPTL